MSISSAIRALVAAMPALLLPLLMLPSVADAQLARPGELPPIDAAARPPRHPHRRRRRRRRRRHRSCARRARRPPCR